MGVLIAAVASLTGGTLDFLGGRFSKRAENIAISFWMEFIAMCCLLPVCILVSGKSNPTALTWGFMGGAIGGLAYTLFFRELSRKSMSTVAAVAALAGLLTPVFWGIAIGDRPSKVTILGMIIAVLAVLIVSTNDPTEIFSVVAQIRRIGLPLLAGIGFGFFYVSSHYASEGHGLWPAFFGFVGAALSLRLISLLSHTSVKLPKDLYKPLLLMGLLDAITPTAYLLANRHGLLSIVSVVGSLYPAVTVMLAWFFLKERITRWHAVGLAGALAALILISASVT